MMSRWRPTAIAALGAGLFLLFVAAGAFAIVSLMPAAVAVAPPKGIFLADTAAPGASPALAWTEGRAEPAAVTPPREPPPPAAAR
ncbi:hypothetical protein, partial [Methylobacterium segetis]|uniref:hypothetical protein n=1 Tax=Methylobacterium segetis TaxID=2488750 RepID=UPI001A9DB6E3